MVNDYLVRRSFNVLYIWIDAILLLAFLCILARTRAVLPSSSDCSVASPTSSSITASSTLYLERVPSLA